MNDGDLVFCIISLFSVRSIDPFLREIKDLVRALHVMPQDFGSFSDISYDLRERVENKLVCKKLSDRKGQKNHCYVVFFCQVRSNLVILAHNFRITRTRRHNL